MSFPKKDQLKLISLYEHIINENKMPEDDRGYASGTIEDIINELKYWLKETEGQDEGQTEDFKQWLQEAELTVNNPGRRKRFFDSLNKATDNKDYIIAYMIPNFGELDGSAWKYYTVRYRDGQAYKLKLIDYKSPCVGGSCELLNNFNEPEKMGNACTIGEIIEHIEYMLNPESDNEGFTGFSGGYNSWESNPEAWKNDTEEADEPDEEADDDAQPDEWLSKVLGAAKKSVNNPKLREMVMKKYIQDDPSLIPNYGEIEGVYSDYTIIYPDGKKYKISI